MKTALVIGCAANVWAEVAAAKALANYDAIYCVKQIGIYYPDAFDYWITLHPEAMDEYEMQRYALGYPNSYSIVAPPSHELGSHGAKGNIARRISYLWSTESNASASSGIYGAKVALADGFERVVLAGVPMSPEGGHFMPESRAVSGHKRGKIWSGCAAFESGFNTAIPFLKGKVKSMSGNTMKVLGSPTSVWLHGI